MTESQIWRDRFAHWEAQELKNLPLPSTLSALEHAQYEIALDFFQREFRLKDSRFPNHIRPPFHLEIPHLVRADEPTRQAFFDYFGFERPIDVFCLREDQKYDLPGVMESGVLPYLRWHHTFASCSTIAKGRLERIQMMAPLPESLPLNELFLRSSGSYYGPMSAQGKSDLWHWNGTTLELLPQFNSSWVS